MKIIHQRTVQLRSTKVKHIPKQLFGSPVARLEDLIKQVNGADHATMPKAALKALFAELEAHYLSNEKRSPFDPSGLPELALTKCPGHPWLAEALRACTVQWAKDGSYSCFIDPLSRKREWKFAATLMLDCPKRGGLAIDILQGQRIGGIEFLDAVMGGPTSAEGLERELRKLAAIRTNK